MDEFKTASHPVIEGLRRALIAARGSSAFIAEMETRIRQLMVDMVDGRVLPRQEADSLRASLLDLVRSEALTKFADRNPNDALRILDKLKAYGFTQLENERPKLEVARASKLPAPPPADWPEISELRAAADQHPDMCSLGAPVPSVYFAKELKDDGIVLPDELLRLYAACDGFDLSCLSARDVPVFSLLSVRAIDISEETDAYPRRAVLFQGGDEVQFSVFRDRNKQWWLVYEHEYEPLEKRALDLRELVRFGLGRMNAATAEALDDQWSWERFLRGSTQRS